MSEPEDRAAAAADHNAAGTEALFGEPEPDSAVAMAPSPTLHVLLQQRQLLVTLPEAADEVQPEWYRPSSAVESLSGHCDNYIEAISYYTFVENAYGVQSVLARAGRQDVYKTLMWEGPFKGHVGAFLLEEISSVDVCSRLNLALSDLHNDLNALKNVTKKFIDACTPPGTQSTHTHAVLVCRAGKPRARREGWGSMPMPPRPLACGHARERSASAAPGL